MRWKIGYACHGCSVDQVHTALDHHPIEPDRDTFLKRTLAMELVELGGLQQAFREKALVDRDVAAGGRSANIIIIIAEKCDRSENRPITTITMMLYGYGLRLLGSLYREPASLYGLLPSRLPWPWRLSSRVLASRACPWRGMRRQR